MLHWLGGGAHTWNEVGHGLAARGVRFAALDLPGFGDAATRPATDVSAAAGAVMETIRELRASSPDQPWMIGGHSMGGKLAAVVARRALNGEVGLEQLRGLVLISPSPTSPEPIEESRREEHLKTFGESAPDPLAQRKAAERWVDRNTGKLPLPAVVRERAIEGVLNNNQRAYRAWFLTGSKEDWSERFGSLPIPAVVMVGTEETSLGEDVQRKDTLPHLPRANLIVLEGMKHLAPLERPGEVMEHITEFLVENGLELKTPESGSGTATDFLMRSDRTAPQTLDIMTKRLDEGQNWNRTPELFTRAEFRTLRALAGCVVPDAGFDLAACIDVQLASNKGDGWRFAKLPPDPEAWRRGLLSLDLAAHRAHGVRFVALYPDQQEALLQQVASGEVGRGILATLHLGEAAKALPAAELKQWFGDVCAEFTRFYMADPRTMDRIGYTGFADDLGFANIQLGQQEEFER